MKTEEKLRLRWFEALYFEDSRKVSALLAHHPSLLEVGWGSEASKFKWEGKPWKERTALHVGVKRGNAALVEQVLILCKVAIPKHSTNGEQERGDPPSTNGEGQADLEEIEEAKKNNDDIADAAHDDTTGEGDREPAKSTRSANAQPAEKEDSSDSDSEDSNDSDSEEDKDQDDTFLRSRDLFMAKDGEYDLDATAIAALYGNRKIVLLLMYAGGQWPWLINDSLKVWNADNPDSTDSDLPDLPALDVTEDTKEDREHRAKLREVTEQVVQSFSLQPTSYGASCLEEYGKHLDFNFLPWQEYLFHFLFTPSTWDRSKKKRTSQLGFGRALWTAVRSCSDSPWQFLLELQDGRGRTPLHVAVDNSFVRDFGRTVAANHDGKEEEEVVECAMAARDGAGRTALHRSLATGRDSESFDYSLGQDSEKLALLVDELWDHSMRKGFFGWTRGFFNVEGLSHRNGFQRSSRRDTRCSPRQSAIIHVHGRPFRQWLKRAERKKAGGTSRMKLSLQERSKSEWKFWGLYNVFPWEWRGEMRGELHWLGIDLDLVELAALVGEASSVKALPLALYNSNSELDFRRRGCDRWPALHIAANAGNYEMLKLFLDAPSCDPYIEDWQGNTALHHALNVCTIGRFERELLDYVDCEHIQRNDPRKEVMIPDNDPLAERQGCINLLLQAGCDIFKTNKEGQPPYPQGQLSKNSKFLSWWYERQAKEFDSTQSTLSSAANAVSVTATLVATASYVGPLQPPMGVGGDPSQIQDENLWVRFFIFCDTMSFYLAIVAITLSLIPSLPMPQQHMKDEVRRTRRMVAMSVIVLFPSIIFVLIAFVSSSIAVVSAKVTSTGGSLTITTASIGGLFCLVTFILFFAKLLAFVFPRVQLVRKIYNATSF